MLKNKIEAVLPLVQKPARYTGGELNSVVKNKENVELTFISYTIPFLIESMDKIH